MGDTEVGAALSLDRERPRFYSGNQTLRICVNHNNAMCLTAKCGAIKKLRASLRSFERRSTLGRRFVRFAVQPRQRGSVEVRSGYRPQSSSASRFTAGAFGFLILTQCGERPTRSLAGVPKFHNFCHLVLAARAFVGTLIISRFVRKDVNQQHACAALRTRWTSDHSG